MPVRRIVPQETESVSPGHEVVILYFDLDGEAATELLEAPMGTDPEEVLKAFLATDYVDDDLAARILDPGDWEYNWEYVGPYYLGEQPTPSPPTPGLTPHQKQVQEALDAINAHRRRIGQRPLDSDAAGWSEKDILREARRVTRANPRRKSLKQRLMR